jgi:hypothetical protein|tara:strand:+ start:75 stop:509 length:435 start_codon:yes stop_codon:yes gene_type:complete
MLTVFTNVIPILLGFFAKLLALRSQSSTENQKLMLTAFTARNEDLNNVRDRAEKESPAAAWNRRFIILSLIGLIIFLQVAPALFDIQTVIPTVREGFSFLGFQLTPDKIEYITVTGLMKFTEVFEWVTLIVEMYFGAQLAKGTR